MLEIYLKVDIYILKASLVKIEEEYNQLNYSITDANYHGIASIVFDHGCRYLKGNEFHLFKRPLYNRCKECYQGGIVEVNDLNLKQEEVHCYDVRGLYPYMMLKYSYPIGVPEEIENPPNEDLDKLFGSIKAVVIDEEGKVPLGIPCKMKKEFNRFKGRVLYRGTTEELKNWLKLGAKLERIEWVLHYPNRKEGRELWGESIEIFERIKKEGEREGNEGKRTFGKLGNNSQYGRYGLDWDSYGIKYFVPSLVRY